MNINIFISISIWLLVESVAADRESVLCGGKHFYLGTAACSKQADNSTVAPYCCSNFSPVHLQSTYINSFISSWKSIIACLNTLRESKRLRKIYETLEHREKLLLPKRCIYLSVNKFFQKTLKKLCIIDRHRVKNLNIFYFFVSQLVYQLIAIIIFLVRSLFSLVF